MSLNQEDPFLSGKANDHDDRCDDDDGGKQTASTSMCITEEEYSSLDLDKEEENGWPFHCSGGVEEETANMMNSLMYSQRLVIIVTNSS